MRWRLKSPAPRLFTQPFIQAQIKKHQISASLAFVRGIHRWPVNSPHKGPVTRKMFIFDDVIMSWQISGMCLKTGGRSCFALPPANSIIDYFLKNASGRFDRVLWIALWIHKRQCFKAYTPHLLKKIALNCHKTIRLICKSRSKYISMTVDVLLYKILMWSVKNLAWLVSPLQREYLFVIRHCFNIELFVAGFGRCVCPCVYVNIWLTVGPGTLEMLHHRVLFLLWQLIFCT